MFVTAADRDRCSIAYVRIIRPSVEVSKGAERVVRSPDAVGGVTRSVE